MAAGVDAADSGGAGEFDEVVEVFVPGELFVASEVVGFLFEGGGDALDVEEGGRIVWSSGWCPCHGMKDWRRAMSEASGKQKAFARLVFQGMNQREAYRQGGRKMQSATRMLPGC